MQVKRLFWAAIAAAALLLIVPSSAFADEAASQQDGVVGAAERPAIAEESGITSLSDDDFVETASVPEPTPEEPTIGSDSDMQGEGEDAIVALGAEQGGEVELDLPVDDSASAGSAQADTEILTSADSGADGVDAQTASSAASGKPAEAAKEPAAKPAAAAKGSAAKAAADAKAAPAAKAADAPHTASVSYRVHVQDDGWKQGWKTNGQMAGTSGRSLRLESIEFKVASDLPGAIYCQVHVQGVGWQRLQGAAVGGKEARSGTTGQSLRLEAIKFTLSGELSKWYDVRYCVHVQDIGWQDEDHWRSNGQMAGTEGRSLRLEAIKLMLVRKEPAPAASASDGGPGLVYSAHVQDVGWQAQAASGQVAGTSGRSLRVEALRVWLDGAAYKGGVKYLAHVQNVGWQKKEASNGAVSGTTGQSLRVEALRVWLTDEIANHYDVVYRAHVQDVGWQPWVVNGGLAGTTGRSLRVEAVQIKLVRKGSYSLSEGAYEFTTASDASFALDDPGYSASSGAQMQVKSRSGSQAQKFYVRPEGSGAYSVQVVASGLFLADRSGKVVQVADSSSDSSQRWTASWDGGVVLANASTGKVLALAASSPSDGAKAVLQPKSQAASSQRWVLGSTQLIADGFYEIQSRNGTYIDVANASYSNGANVQACTRNGSPAQRFRIYMNSGSYVIENCKSYAVLDVIGLSKANGANVMQQAWNGGANQRWTAEINREGYITFRSKNSGKVLEIAGNSKKSGANIQQYAANGSTGQQWKLARSSRYSQTGDAELDRIVANVLRTRSTLKSVFDYVAYGFSYRDGNKHWSGWSLSDSRSRSYAIEMYNYGSGNCYRFASLFAWLARGLGYTDVVVRTGWVVGYTAPQAPHGWVTVNGYICDPDMQHEASSRNWYWQTWASAPTAYYDW